MFFLVSYAECQIRDAIMIKLIKGGSRMLTYKRYDIKKGLTRTKTRLAVAFSALALGAGGAFGSLAIFGSAHAAGTTVVVTPTNTQGWSTADTRPGGAVNFVQDNTAPGSPNNGALQLTTDATTTAKAQYLHAASGSINDVNELSYYTKQVSGPPVADPSYQLAIDVNGSAAGGFTNLVFEPYWNPTQGPIINNVWQQWNVANGLFWSSGTITCSNGGLVSGAGGPPLYTLAQVKTMCPEAMVVDFGVNVGSNNPDYNVETDLVDFNGTTYNFEPFAVASDKDACKNDGWKSVTDANGQAFKNQGQCVAYTNHNNGVGQDDVHAKKF
jgi:hypothetical protein